MKKFFLLLLALPILASAAVTIPWNNITGKPTNLGALTSFAAGVPNNGSGNDGDIYYRTDSPYGVYKRTSGVWLIQQTFALSNDGRFTDQRVPSDASVTAVKIAAALKPSGTAATTDESLRALGTAAGNAAPGNDVRILGSVSALASNALALTPGRSQTKTATWSSNQVLTYTGGSNVAGDSVIIDATVTAPITLTVTPTSATVYRNGSTSALSAAITVPIGHFTFRFWVPNTGSTLYLDDTVFSGGDIPLTDAGGYFTTKNVEAALQQLGAGGGGGGVDATGTIKLWATADVATPLAAGWLACDGTNGTLTLADVSGGARYIVKGAGTVAAPSFSPAAGTYGSTQSVAITSATSGATIKYTVDGSTPSRSVGTTYSGAVSIAATSGLKAIAFKNLYGDSGVTSGTYTISGGGGTTGTASDNFNSLAGGANLGGSTNWTAVINNLAISSNGAARGVFKSTGASTEAVVIYTPLGGTGDQYSQFFLRNINGTTPATWGLGVRCNTTGGGNGYYCVYSGSTVYVKKIVSGTVTDLYNFTLGGLAVDDGVRMTVTGTSTATRISFQKSNGGGGFFEVNAATDPGSPYMTSGSPALAGYSNNASSADMDDWTGSVSP